MKRSCAPRRDCTPFLAVTTVAVIDAALIGLGLSILGVPLVLSLAVLTFFAAFF